MMKDFQRWDRRQRPRRRVDWFPAYVAGVICLLLLLFVALVFWDTRL